MGATGSTGRHDAFAAPARDAWTARPTDPQDVFVAERVGQSGAKVALFGVPFDGAVLGRKGAREGPLAIREAMAKLKPWTLAGGESALTFQDWGDARVVGDDVAAAHAATEAAARAVIDARQFPLALGGDHSLTFPLVKAHGRRVGVINLDAHLDVRDVHGAPNSGTSFGRLLDAGIVAGEDLVELGIRDFANSPRYAEKARKAGATIIGADEWAREGIAAVDRAIDAASRRVDAVYLSIDIDVLDQAHAPGVSAPTPGGVDTRTLFAAVRRIAQRAPLVGADVVEVAPNLDRDGMTARAAAYTLMHLLAGLAGRRSS